MGMYLTGVLGVHLSSVCLRASHIRVLLMGVHLTVVHLIGVHLTGVHLTGVGLMGGHLHGRASPGHAPHSVYLAGACLMSMPRGH